ncbi:hypothetical protein DM02DRAFT_694929 [Periconia macrospinosa]|uniref:Uncharacterized protein n=1 Tax=Periconia macrospinosa TaxID=97972 RepID=A0A2V1D6P2_9PLEO|nr:hypothetical protein DM02DRAFT_694929 [Periconia macrospinosa]
MALWAQTWYSALQKVLCIVYQFFNAFTPQLSFQTFLFISIERKKSFQFMSLEVRFIEDSDVEVEEVTETMIISSDLVSNESAHERNKQIRRSEENDMSTVPGNSDPPSDESDPTLNPNGSEDRYRVENPNPSIQGSKFGKHLQSYTELINAILQDELVKSVTLRGTPENYLHGVLNYLNGTQKASRRGEQVQPVVYVNYLVDKNGLGSGGLSEASTPPCARARSKSVPVWRRRHELHRTSGYKKDHQRNGTSQSAKAGAQKVHWQPKGLQLIELGGHQELLQSSFVFSNTQIKHPDDSHLYARARVFREDWIYQETQIERRLEQHQKHNNSSKCT